MRTSLAPYLNDFVLCRGWIAFWEELKEHATRRVVISQATIKKADKDLLYEKQEVISTEHHLNLFIKHEDLPNYEMIFELNEIINFTGVVEEYTRTDGSRDYGIYANKQSTLPFEIEKLRKGFDEALNSIEDFEKSLEYLKNYAKPKTRELLLRFKEIEDGGKNNFPTFHKTLKGYATVLADLYFSIPDTISSYENYVSSRHYRRSKKKRKSSLHLVSQMREKKTKSKSKKQINELRNNLKGGFKND